MSGVDRERPGLVAAGDQLVAEVRAKVREHGVQIIHVFPTVDEPGLPFAYTVGLTAADCPELVLAGVAEPELVHGILNDLAQRVIGGGRGAYEWGERLVDPFGTGYDVALLLDADALEAEPRFVPSFARRLYGDATFLQVVWQDRAYRWPWDEGFDVGQGDDGYPLLGPVPKWARS